MEQVSWHGFSRSNHAVSVTLETAVTTGSDCDVLQATSTVLSCMRRFPNHEYFILVFEEFERRLVDIVAYVDRSILLRTSLSPAEFNAGLLRVESIMVGETPEQCIKWADAVEATLNPLLSKLSKPLPPGISEDSVVRGIRYHYILCISLRVIRLNQILHSHQRASCLDSLFFWRQYRSGWRQLTSCHALLRFKSPHHWRPLSAEAGIKLRMLYAFEDWVSCFGAISLRLCWIFQWQ